jgi:hypothetical protein
MKYPLRHSGVARLRTASGILERRSYPEAGLPHAISSGAFSHHLRVPWSDSEGADGSGFHRFQFPSGSEAPTKRMRLSPVSEFVPDLFAPLPPNQGIEKQFQGGLVFKARRLYITQL